MADKNQPKAPSKAGENTLGLIGAIAGLAGNLILGPDSAGIDFGAPFKAGASMLREKREQQSLLELLKGNPHTAPLAEMGPALVQAGGLINNPDVLSHPDTQNYLGQFSGPSGTAPATPAPASGILPGEQNGTPHPGLLPALGTQKAPPPDYTSEEFLARAAALRPDIAEKIITAKATKDPANQTKELLQTILLGKQISGFETPEERRAAQHQDRMTQLETTDRLIQGRQEQNQIRQNALEKSKVTPKETEGFQQIDEVRNNYRNMLIDLESGVKPSYTKDIAAKLLPGGERALQAFDPKFAAFRKNVEQANALFQKTISGVAISEPEAKRLRPTQPQAGDDPAVFKLVAENNVKKATELSLLKAMLIVNRGGTDIYNTVPQDQIRLYKAVRDAMNYNLKDALANPRVQAIRRQLGIDYGLDNLK